MALNVPAVHVAAVDLVCVDFAACPVALLSISSQASTTISRHGPAHPASSAGTSRPSAACIIATNIAPPDLRGQRRAGFGMRSLHFEATERAHDDRVRKFLYFTPVAATMYRPAHEFSRDHAQPDFHIKCMFEQGRAACRGATAGVRCVFGETQAPHQTAHRPSSAHHSIVSRRLRMDGIPKSLVRRSFHRFWHGVMRPSCR